MVGHRSGLVELTGLLHGLVRLELLVFGLAFAVVHVDDLVAFLDTLFVFAEIFVVLVLRHHVLEILLLVAVHAACVWSGWEYLQNCFLQSLFASCNSLSSNLNIKIN